MDELRSKIAALVEPHLDGVRGDSDSDYAAEQRALSVADRILAIPELRAKLEMAADHETEGAWPGEGKD